MIKFLIKSLQKIDESTDLLQKNSTASTVLSVVGFLISIFALTVFLLEFLFKKGFFYNREVAK